MTEPALKSFGACLSELLTRHKMSAASVSRMMGHKSRTTLRRILQDQANVESMKKFLDDFTAARLIPLTQEEELELQRALDVSRLGMPGFLARRSIWNLLHNPPCNSSGEAIELHDVQSGRNITPEQFLYGLSRAATINMLIINSIPPSFIESLSSFLKDCGGVKTDIEHYFYPNDDIARSVSFISDIFPALKFSCYTPYAIPLSEHDSLSPCRITASILACRAQFPDGETHEYQLGFTEEHTGYLLCAPAGIYAFWEKMLQPGRSMRQPIKLTAAVSGDSLSDYLSMAAAYRDLEKNHAIYMIKPGLCLSLIPPDLLDSPMRDGMLHTSFRDDPELPEFHRQLMEIHTQRFENIYHKKRVSHILIPYSSLLTFSQTGRLTDHFFGMRPFSVKERREILIHCRNQARDNPYFNIYLMRNTSEPLMFEAICYDPAGILIHTAGTNYSLCGDHADVLITLNDFTALFTQYFRDTLIPFHAHSVSSSVSILTSLIDELPKE